MEKGVVLADFAPLGQQFIALTTKPLANF